MDKDGNLYGATLYGGAYINPSDGEGFGAVFELSPPATPGGAWTESILWNFHGNDGHGTYAGLIVGAGGNLFGTAHAGANSQGTAAKGGGNVFDISPSRNIPPTKLTASPPKLNFRKVVANTTSKPKKVKLTNKGRAAAEISSVNPTAPFMIAGGTDTCSGKTIAPKKSCSFKIVYSPTRVANETGSVDVTYNGTSPLVALKGSGVASR